MERYKRLFTEAKEVKEIFGWVKLKDGKEVDLDGPIPKKFNFNDIVSIGEEDIGDEAGILVTYKDGSEKELKSVKDAKKFFKTFFK